MHRPSCVNKLQNSGSLTPNPLKLEFPSLSPDSSKIINPIRVRQRTNQVLPIAKNNEHERDEFGVYPRRHPRSPPIFETFALVRWNPERRGSTVRDVACRSKHRKGWLGDRFHPPGAAVTVILATPVSPRRHL